MKTKLTLTCAIAALAALASCGKKDEVAPKPIAVDKTVEFKVFASKDYSKSYQADDEVRIYLSIRRRNKKTLESTVVFDTTFYKKLKELPLESNPITINKKISNVIVEDEWVDIGSGARVGGFGYGGTQPFPEDETVKSIEVEW
ncbi:hypothetical protein [Pontibacter cellulosilyticus]|uniref:DUF4352 domain-containing protein n=1 Tax=Pontibacter cellulosilyticus TaxID=1720253 RepID=A0A923N761_9BACT|nr:hypothetical protein [Pontibacter cellulosilyticus]MBC5993029.1 hypothetical protein [Pontibacter cellulosilyticus]